MELIIIESTKPQNMLNFQSNNPATQTGPENAAARIFDLRRAAILKKAQRRN